jgi:ribosome assembly protein RRB1
LRDDFGASRTQFPLTAYLVSATQSNPEEEDSIDQILVTKLTNLQCTRDDDDIDDDSQLIDPTVHCCVGTHPGPCTRIRSMLQQPQIVATLTETENFILWDISVAISASNTETGDGTIQSIFECAIDHTGFGVAFS